MAAAVRKMWLPAIAGVVAVAAGLVVGELVALPIASAASPFQAVAAWLIDVSPGPVRDWAIDTFATKNKLALQTGMSVGIAVIAAAAGVAQSRRSPLGVLICAAFAVAGVLAALGRPTATFVYAIPSVAAGLAAAAILAVLIRLTQTPRPATTGETTPQGPSRRRVLGAFGIVALGTAVGYEVVRRVQSTGGAIAERMGLRLPPPIEPAAPVADTTLLDIEGATSFVTDNDDFYRIDTALQVPHLATTDWQLRIHGMVDREIVLTWDDLLAMPAMERLITLTCVSNEVGGNLAGNARWLGYPMRDILERVGVAPEADMLLSTSVDGWTSGTPLAAVTDGRDAILAIGMNGQPLPFEHGYPVRQVVPGLYGYVSACKWVVDWEITRFDRAQAYWTQRDWGEQAPIKTASRIDRPAPLSTHPVGEPIVIAGTAWAQGRGISAVEVRIDDGPWQQAELATEYTVDTWRQWSWTWPSAEAGNHTVHCRATNGDGEVQPEERVAPLPDGATGWHSRVLRIGA